MGEQMQFFKGFDQQVATWISRELDMPIGGEMRCVGVIKDGQIIAGAAFHNYKGFDCEVSLATTDKRFCTKRILREFFDYGFNFLKCVRLSAYCAKNNKDIRKFLTKLGFKEEGCHRLAYDGKQDAVSYSLLKHECRWI